MLGDKNLRGYFTGRVDDTLQAPEPNLVMFRSGSSTQQAVIAVKNYLSGHSVTRLRRLDASGRSRTVSRHTVSNSLTTSESHATHFA